MNLKWPEAIDRDTIHEMRDNLYLPEISFGSKGHSNQREREVAATSGMFTFHGLSDVSIYRRHNIHGTNFLIIRSPTCHDWRLYELA